MPVEVKVDLSNLKNQYETTFLTVPTLTEEEYKAVVSKFEKLIAELDGEITNLEHWGQKRLEYEMENHSNAYYTYLEYDAPGTLIDKMELEFRYDERVLRYLTVKVGKHHAAFNKKRREQGFGKKDK